MVKYRKLTHTVFYCNFYIVFVVKRVHLLQILAYSDFIRPERADTNQSYIIGPKGELYKCWVDLGKKDKEIGHIADTKLNLSLISEYVVGTDKYSDAKCIDCFLFPVCDGGCGLYRFDYKKYGKDYNVCPINPEDLNLLLELFYEKQIQK